MNTLFLDIETIKADNYIDFMPEELKNPPEFKAEIKRLKKDTDETYNEKIAQAETEHNYKQEQKRNDWIKKCALSPLTGRVACAGLNFTDTVIICHGKTEYEVLFGLNAYLETADLIVGHNIKEFDLWFLYNRCRKYGIEFPNKLYKKYNGRFYWSENIIDTMDLWGCGKYKEMISLNNLAKYFGLGTKDNHISKNFEEIWDTDRERAIEHCKGDVILTKQIYDKLK